MLIEDELSLAGKDAELRSRHLNKKQWRIRGVIGVVILGLLVFTIFSGHKVYKPYSQDDLHYQERIQELEEATKDAKSWTRYPTDIAKFIAGGSVGDGETAEFTTSTQNSNESTTIILLYEDLMDDAISAKQIKVDFLKQNGTWEIEFAGERWRCHRAPFLSIGWTIRPCS